MEYIKAFFSPITQSVDELWGYATGDDVGFPIISTIILSVFFTVLILAFIGKEKPEEKPMMGVPGYKKKEGPPKSLEELL